MWEFLITLWRGPKDQFRTNLSLGSKYVLIAQFYKTSVIFLGPGTYLYYDILRYTYDIPKDSVFVEIFFFSNIFGFPVVKSPFPPASAGTQISENPKPKNYRSDITFPECVPPLHLSFTENWVHIKKKTIKKCQEFIRILTLISLNNSL